MADLERDSLPTRGAATADAGGSLFDEVFGPGGAAPAGASPTAAVRAAAPTRAEAAVAPTRPRSAAPPAARSRPAPVEGRGRRRRYKARRVKRIVRHVDVWSVLKVSILFWAVLWLTMMVTGVVLWNGAQKSGNVESVEELIAKLFGYKEFHFVADQIFRSFAVGGAVICVFLTGFTVLAVLIFNLISDLTGGVRVTVIEVENATLRRAARQAAADGGARRQRSKGTPAPEAR